MLRSVAARGRLLPGGPAENAAPIRSHNFIRFNNIPNMLRYLYEKPPYTNRKCGCPEVLQRKQPQELYWDQPQEHVRRQFFHTPIPV